MGTCIELYSYVLLQLLFAEEGLSHWQWYRSTSLGGPAAPSTSQSADHGQEGQKPQPAAEFEGFSAIAGATGRLYVPAKADEGCVLRVQCTPGSRCVFMDPCTVENSCSLTDNRPRHCQFAHSKSTPAKLHMLL